MAAADGARGLECVRVVSHWAAFAPVGAPQGLPGSEELGGFVFGAVTTLLHHRWCGAHTPWKRTNGWRGGGTNAARRAMNCVGVMRRI